ncbi:MAG: hypothetical protein ACTSXT_01425 [Candidatus Helarchaeota archaeon]
MYNKIIKELVKNSIIKAINKLGLEGCLQGIEGLKNGKQRELMLSVYWQIIKR